jgi:hypothetical protein
MAALLAAAVPASAGWNCMYKTGGPGTQNLLRTKHQFNLEWGKSRLWVGAKQCDITTCHGALFGICNPTGKSIHEHPNARNIAAAQNPGTGNGCALRNGPQQYFYVYGTEKWTIPLKMVIRRCTS